MNAGLPTTGIGGIFYMISVIMMVITELILTIRGKSSVLRWKFVFGQVVLVIGIILSSFLTTFVLIQLAPKSITHKLSAIFSSAPATQVNQGAQFVLYSPLIILFGLLVFTQIIRGYFVLKEKVSTRKRQK